MKHFLKFILNVFSFGILPLVKRLVLKKKRSRSVYIDWDKDGNVDIEFTLHSDHDKEEEHGEEESNV